jgi:hypothetical protein
MSLFTFFLYAFMVNTTLSSDDYIFQNNNYEISEYLYNNKTNSFLLKVKELETNSIKYFTYKNHSLESFLVNSIFLKNYRIVGDEINDFKLKYIDNKIIEERLGYSIQIDKNIYILSLIAKDDIHHEDLYYFDGKVVRKIDLKNIIPLIAYYESSMYFDQKEKNIYFSACRVDKKGNKIDYGIYTFNTNSKKVLLFHSMTIYNDKKQCLLTCPYLIPKTDLIIMKVKFCDKDFVILKKRFNKF